MHTHGFLQIELRKLATLVLVTFLQFPLDVKDVGVLLQLVVKQLLPSRYTPVRLRSTCILHIRVHVHFVVFFVLRHMM